jgi:serine/threonine-protein kinase
MLTIDRLCGQFEAAWKATPAGGSPPRSEAYLHNTPEPDRDHLLRQLLLIEVDYRRRAGQTPRLVEYRERFPNLDRAWLAGLVGAEPDPAAEAAGFSTLNGPSGAADSAGTFIHEAADSAKHRDLPQAASRAAVSPDSSPRQIGRYRLLELLGSGGMGAVYKAEDPSLRRVVALKLPHLVRSAATREAEQRFLREARAAAVIRHPHVCPIHDVGEDQGNFFLVMAYVEGETLADRLARLGRFDDLREAVSIACQVAEGLAAIHSHGIVHRDLKPANIMIDQGGQVVLTDFGLARTTTDTEHVTAEGTLLGTPAYMAPEQAAGKGKEIGSWTDVYSLGVVLFRMITGQVPFDGPVHVIIYKVIYEEPPLPSSLRAGLDADLEAIVVRAMARRPEDRFPSAEALAAELRQWMDGTSGSRRTLSSGQIVRDTTTTRVRSDLPGGSSVEVSITQPGGASGKVRLDVAEKIGKRRRRRKLVVSITLALSLLLAVGIAWRLNWESATDVDHRGDGYTPKTSAQVRAFRMIQGAIDSGRLDIALALVNDERQYLGTEKAAAYRTDILKAWLKKAEALYDDNQVAQANIVWTEIKNKFNDPDITREVDQRVQAIRSTPFHKAWEEVEKLIAERNHREALAKLKTIQPPPGREKANADMVARARNVIGDDMLKVADKLAGSNPSTCLQILNEVKELCDDKTAPLSSDLYARWKEAYTLALVRNPKSTPEERTNAVRLFDELLSGTPKRLPELAREFLKLATLNPDEVPPLLFAAQAKLKKGEVKELDEYMRGLLGVERRRKFELALRQAEEAFDKNQLTVTRMKLELATESLDSQDAKARDRVQGLSALLNARRSKAGHEEAARVFEELLKKGVAYRRAQMCEAFAKLAESDPNTFLARALGSIGPALSTLDNKEKAQVTSHYQKLIENSMAELRSGADWNSLVLALEKTPGAWAAAARSEALAEKSLIRPDPADIAKARSAIAEALKTKDTGSYGRYVEALVLFASTPRDAVKTRQALIAAFPLGKLPSLMGTRKTRAAEMCLDAAKQLRTPDKPDAPFRDAEAAYQLLLTVNAYSPGADVRLPLALAAWSRPNPDLSLADKLTKALEADPGLAKLGPDAYALLLGKARGASLAMDTPGALSAFEQIIKLNRKREITRDRVGLYQLVCKPALDLVAQLPKGKPRAMREARLKADLGDLYRGHPAEFENALQKASDLFTEAIALDPRAEYLIKRATTRIRMATAKGSVDRQVIAAMEDDCDKALALVKQGDKYFIAHAFKGYLLQMRARMTRNDSDKQKELFHEALTSYQKAIDMARGQEDETTEIPTIHYNRIDVWLGLAALEKDPAKRKEYLDGAKHDADGAVQLDSHPSVDRYYFKYGEVLEARSWELGEKEYGGALLVYQLAASKKPLAVYRIGAIRCAVKLAKYGTAKSDTLTSAAKTYNEAMTAAVKPTDLEQVGLDYWIGNVYWLQGKHAEARAAFERVLKAAKGKAAPGMAAFYRDALTDLIEMSLQQAEVLLAANPADEMGLKLRDDSRTRAAQLKALDPASAVRFIGWSYEMGEGRDAKKALQEYDAVEGMSPADPRLFSARLRLLVEPKFKAFLLEARQNLNGLADKARKLADSPGVADPWVKASLLANAGLAKNEVGNKADAIKLLKKAVSLATLYHPRLKAWSAKLAELQQN